MVVIYFKLIRLGIFHPEIIIQLLLYYITTIASTKQ